MKAIGCFDDMSRRRTIKSKSPNAGASVTDRGLEPRTNCLRGNCSAIELVGRAARIILQRMDVSMIAAFLIFSVK
jgi:hypothetical protein